MVFWSVWSPLLPVAVFFLCGGVFLPDLFMVHNTKTIAAEFAVAHYVVGHRKEVVLCLPGETK